MGASGKPNLRPVVKSDDLTAYLRGGILASAWRVGVCRSCRARLTQGAILSSRKEGKVLSCSDMVFFRLKQPTTSVWSHLHIG